MTLGRDYGSAGRAQGTTIGDFRHFRQFRHFLMGFIRQQEEKLAVRFLSWQYEKLKKPIPAEAELEQQAAKIVEEAHDIARNRGRNVMSIIKDLIADIRK